MHMYSVRKDAARKCSPKMGLKRVCIDTDLKWLPLEKHIAYLCNACQNLEVMNEDKTRVQHHKLEGNDELRMKQSTKEMLHV